MDDIYAITDNTSKTVDFVTSELLNHMRPLKGNCSVTKLVPASQLAVANQMIEQLQKSIVILKSDHEETLRQLLNSNQSLEERQEEIAMLKKEQEELLASIEEKDEKIKNLQENVIKPTNYWQLDVLEDGLFLYSLKFKTREAMEKRKDEINSKYEFIFNGRISRMQYSGYEVIPDEVRFDDDDEKNKAAPLPKIE